MAISPTSVQDEPSQNSVSALLTSGGEVAPPTAIASVEVPAGLPDIYCLPVFKSDNSVQAVPFHSSVSSLLVGLPPKIIPDVCVTPEEPGVTLAVFTSATSDQLEPLYSSTTSVTAS